MYLMTCTRPDLAYPLSILARYVAPGRHRPEHMAAAKRVLRYLCSTSGMGLVLAGQSPVVLTGHADASWANDQSTQRSSQGYTFSLGSGSVSWRATRSSSVLSSTCEAEIYAGAMAAQELRWLTYLLTDLGEPPRSPPVLYVDNKAMLALCREQRLEHRTKHIALRYFLARELQQRGQLRLAYVASEANTADVFTKALAPCDHQRFCTQLACFALPYLTGLVTPSSPPLRLWGTAQALYDAVVARYSSPATASLGRLLLPYLFPELSAFATVADLVTHLRTSDARYRATIPAEFLATNQSPMFITLHFTVSRLPYSLRSIRDQFLSLDPTSLIVDLLETSVLLRLVQSTEAARARVAGVVEVAAVVVEVAVGAVVGAAVEVVEAVKVVAAVGLVAAVGALVAAMEAAEGVAAAEVVGLVVAGLDLGMEALVVVSDRSSSVEDRCFSHLDDAWRAEFGDDVERPRWTDLLRSGVAIFDLEYDAIIFVMYALCFSAEGECYRCVPPDPGIAATALGASASGASASCTPPGTAPAEALHNFTLDSGASRCFFRNSTTLTPLPAPISVRMADPSGGPVVAYSSTVLLCLAVPSGSLSGLHLPLFSTNLVSTATLQDAMVTTTTPGGQPVSICTCTWTGRHLATFTHRPGSSLYTLATKPPQVAASAQVVASAQVFASGHVATSCSCRLLSHQTLLWHHRLGHPSLPRLRGMHSHFLVSGLPRSLPPLPPLPAPPCLPCVEGWQRAAPHSSLFPLTTAPLQTLHMDVWGPAHVSGQSRERYFLLVVDDYTRYTTVFPLRSKGEVVDVLIPWIRTVRLQLRERFGQDLPVLCLHSDRGGEFSFDLLREFCRGEGIL
ncbi:unnamed protein product [Closterium sp. NIES-53]